MYTTGLDKFFLDRILYSLLDTQPRASTAAPSEYPLVDPGLAFNVQQNTLCLTPEFIHLIQFKLSDFRLLKSFNS